MEGISNVRLRAPLYFNDLLLLQCFVYYFAFCRAKSRQARERGSAAVIVRFYSVMVRLDAREEAKAAAAPKTAVICPYCGASTIPDERGCCEWCGGAINA